MPQDVSRIEKLYTRALELFGPTSPGIRRMTRKDSNTQFLLFVDVWLHYAKFYLNSNQQERALSVFWKARKTLSKTARVEFINSYQQFAVGLPQGGAADT
jgi:hypothetical protein